MTNPQLDPHGYVRLGRILEIIAATLFVVGVIALALIGMNE